MRYWKRVNQESNTTTVESYSHDLAVEGAIEIDQVKYDAFIASLPKPEPEVVRDLATEIDDLKAIISDHEARLKKDVGGHIR